MLCINVFLFILNAMLKLNVSENNLDFRDVSQKISKKCCSDIYEDINLFKRQINKINCIYTKNIWQFLFAILFILWAPKNRLQ